MKLRRTAVVLFTFALLIVGLAVFTNVVPYRQIVEQRRQLAASEVIGRPACRAGSAGQRAAPSAAPGWGG